MAKDLRGFLLSTRVEKGRWLSRSGSLLLNFDGLMVAGSKPASVSASIVGVDLDRRSRTKIDSEGMLRGAHPGKLWTLINLGTTGGIAKVSDDGLQLVIEAVVSTATDVSTAGTGRIAASCASAVFMITRHGRDVVLPKFTEMNIVFNGSVAVPESQATARSVNARREGNRRHLFCRDVMRCSEVRSVSWRSGHRAQGERRWRIHGR